MATDYGGTHGSQPWHGAQPPYPGRPYPGQPPQGQQPYGQPHYGQAPHAGWPAQGGPPQGGQPQGQPYGVPAGAPYDPHSGQPWANGPIFPAPPRQELSPDTRARRRRRSIAWALLAVGGTGLALSAFGAAEQGGPRKFTAKETQQITDWEYGERWRTLPAGTIFPGSVSYSAPQALDDDPSLALAALRVGIAKQASCASAADPSAVAVLKSDGCSVMLRATYVDETDSFVVTVGAAVLPTSAKARTAARAIGHASGGLGATVHAVPVKGTPADQFTDKQRQLSGVTARGTYVVFYTVGYADSRHRQKISQDNYTKQEMTSAGLGVADHVLSTLAAPVPPPRCPSTVTPGC